MKSKHLFKYTLAGVCALLLSGTRAQASITIEVLTTFVYPAAGNSTRPQKINDAGDIAGSYTDANGVTRGFVRFRNGNFSPPIIEPNEDFLTDVRAINNSRVIAGFYIAASFAHGFFLSGNTFTQFDVPGAINTYIDALNDAGNFGGTIDINGGNQAFVSISGTVTSFSVPGAITSAVFGLNNLNQAAGGYTDSASAFHGFFREADGTLTFPIDSPGSTQTILFGINDKKWIVGRYVDSAGATHGLFITSPASFVTFDFPGSSFTSLNGINRSRLICGRYLDSSGIEHGIVARVKRTP